MPPGQSKVELYAALRRDAREGMSNRALERKYRVGWRTVQKALSSAWPQPREPYAPRRSKLDPFKPVIDQMLLADLDTPRKQRHTVVRIYRRLINEHAMDDVSYQVVRAYVAKRKPEIRVEAGRGPAQVFIEQSHLAGAEAEVDFGEVAVRLRGELVKCHLFCMRLSFSGKAVHRVFASGGQEAFFEGHEHAFRVLGGVPFGKIRYDNLKAAVASVLGFTRRRVETDRWTAFRSHYGIEPFYCTPGIEGAHEKGGVEGQIGWFRRNHFVPVPEIDSLAHLNMLIDEWDRRRGPADRDPSPHDRRAVRRRTAVVEAVARRDVRDRPLVHPTGRPVLPDHRPHQPLLGPDPVHRPPGPGLAARLRARGVRRPHRDRPARTAADQERITARARSLSRSAAAQTGRAARRHGPRTGPGRRPSAHGWGRH